MDSPTLFGPPRRKITRIEPQSRNRSRFSIFLDGEFALGIDGELLAERGLKVGDELSEEDVADLLRADEQKRVKLQAFRYLANRDHSEKELATKLRRKGYSKEAVQWVLDFLRRYQLVNDRAFAAVFARERVIQRPMGRLLLAAELRARGIPGAIIEEVVAEVYARFPEEELAEKLARKKMPSLAHLPPVKARKKLADFLQRRGFGWEVVREVLEKFNRREPEL